MPWTLSDSVDDFLTATGDLLVADPAANTVLLTVSRRIVEAGPTAFDAHPARFGWWSESGAPPVTGAFLETPPYPLRLSPMPPAAADELAADLGRSTASVAGPRALVDAFCTRWKSDNGGSTKIMMNQRLYRLGELSTPDVTGAGRPATANDRDVLVEWTAAFFALDGAPGDPVSAVDSRLESGAFWLWEGEGSAVSMAGASPVVAGMARIGPVYTPPAARGRGYGSAVTAAASADAIRRGAEQVLLYTDLANPTSNAIYQKLGYRPVTDEVIVELATDAA